jgi:hypothetical protein
MYENVKALAGIPADRIDENVAAADSRWHWTISEVSQQE